MALDTRQSEQGVLLPLFAVSALFLIVTFAVYAFDIKLVKDAKAYGENLAIDLCSTAVNQMPFTRKAVNLAVNQLPNDVNGSGQIQVNSRTLITKVRIISPTPRFNYPEAGSALLGSIKDPTASCSICEFEGDINTPAVISKYPQALWNYDSRGLNSKSNGQVSCEISLEVKTFFGDIMGTLLEQSSLQTRSVLAKAAFGSRLRRTGAVRDFDKPVSIVISPHLEIPLSSISTRFTYVGSQSGSVIDPLTNFDSNEIPIDGNIGFSSGNDSRDMKELPDAVLPTNAPHRLVQNKGIPNADARRQLLLGCKNPLIEVRNLAIYSLIERLSRSWFTRRNTQILITGTSGVDAAGTTQTMAPTLLAKYGSDLTTPQFRLPYINFLTDKFGFGGTPTVSGTPKLLCPFEDAQCAPSDPDISKITQSPLPNGMASNDDLRSFQRMAASMLRNCLPLNNQVNGYATAGDRLVDGQNAGYEPTSFSSSSNSSFLEFFPGLGGDDWDLLPNTTTAERMNAAQTVRTLGSIRSCPFDQFTTSAGVLTPGFEHGCQTPEYNPIETDPPAGLQPDILTTCLLYTSPSPRD